MINWSIISFDTVTAVANMCSVFSFNVESLYISSLNLSTVHSGGVNLSLDKISISSFAAHLELETVRKEKPYHVPLKDLEMKCIDFQH